MCSSTDQWTQAGGQFGYDATFSTNIGGYMAGSLISVANMLGASWLSGVDNNTTNPDTGGANWTLTKPASWGALYTSTGTANALAITLSPAPLSFGAITAAQSLAGSTLKIIPNATNTTAATIAINGGTPIAMKRSDGAALQSGDIVSGTLFEGIVTTGGTTLQLVAPVASQIAVTAPLNLCTDTSGAANTIVAAPSPAITYTNGVTVRVDPANANTGPVTFNANSLGAIAVTRPDGSACAPNDILVAKYFDAVIVVSAGPTTTLQMLSWPQNSVGASNSIISANHTYVIADAGTTIFRSNSGVSMVDTVPATMGAVLPNNWRVTIVNADATAMLVVALNGSVAALSGPGVVQRGTTWINLGPGQQAIFSSDGTNYRCNAPARAVCAAPLTVYISTSGSINQSGLTVGTAINVSSGTQVVSAYALVQSYFDLAGYALTFQAAAGTYPTATTTLNGPLVGQNSALIIQGAGSGSTTMSTIACQNGAWIQPQAVTMVAASAGTGELVAQYPGALISLGTGVVMGASVSNKFDAIAGGQIIIGNSYTSSGNAASEWAVNDGDITITGTVVVTLSGTPAYSAEFANSQMLGKINGINATLSFSGTATGNSALANGNAIVNTNGVTLPGNGTVTKTNGGQVM